MASRSRDEVEPPEPDFERLPLGWYRGRGGDQRATGPAGAWMERGPGRYMRWPVEGPARGHAPRNYRRSDEHVREEVCEALAAHGDLDVSDVEVEVDGGDVILRGTVRSRWAKFYAEDLAAGILGVRDVVNELRIAPRGTPTSA
jgi:hypothetical protein